MFVKKLMRRNLSFIFEIIKIFIIALAIVIPIRYFLFQPFVVKGQSMEPNFHSGDYLIIDELSYRFRDPSRGEIIVFRSPVDPSSCYIKRIIGLPGETVEIKDGVVKIYTEQGVIVLNEKSYLPEDIKTPGNIKISLEKDQYFVLGDNRTRSYDSRKFGPLPKENIIGRVYLRAWPLYLSAKIEAPVY